MLGFGGGVDLAYRVRDCAGRVPVGTGSFRGVLVGGGGRKLLGGLVVRSDGVGWCAIVWSFASGGIACRFVPCCEGRPRALRVALGRKGPLEGTDGRVHPSALRGTEANSKMVPIYSVPISRLPAVQT